MKDDFYLTLPSHSSLQEFPNNVNNNFKVGLPRILRLEGDWKVALASISLQTPELRFPRGWPAMNLSCMLHGFLLLQVIICQRRNY